MKVCEGNNAFLKVIKKVTNTNKLQTKERVSFQDGPTVIFLFGFVCILSPGTCTSAETDDMVRAFCEDADIHIFVVSAISTLNQLVCSLCLIMNVF